MATLTRLPEHDTSHTDLLAKTHGVDVGDAPRSPCGALAGLALCPTYTGGTEWCGSRMSGTHLRWDIRWYCENCAWYGPKVADTSQRHCNVGCDWSKAA